jgi:hypothetical protein
MTDHGMQFYRSPQKLQAKKSHPLYEVHFMIMRSHANMSIAYHNLQVNARVNVQLY